MEVANHTGFMLQTMLFMVNHPLNNSLHRIIHNVSSTHTNDEYTICFGVYGCFPLDYPWVDTMRPLTYPRPPDQLKVQFAVFNRFAGRHPMYVDVDDPDKIQQMGINAKGWLYVVTHGHMGKGIQRWVQNFTDTFLENDPHGTASVMVIDWQKTSTLSYAQQVADIRLIGAMTAYVLHMIAQEVGMRDLDKVHLLGHSLGAHLCGYVGYHLQKDFGLQVGRITGMDPSDLMFSDTDPIVRLDTSDAKFVDVIHTHSMPPRHDRWSQSSSTPGMYQAMGHVDFYPNGGNNQPGCNESQQELLYKNHYLSCDHVRSHQLYMDAIQQRCSFVAIGCESFEQFRDGDCFECNEDGHYCIDFGPNAWNSYRRLIENGVMAVARPVRAFMITGEDSPFCRSPFKVTLFVSDGEESIVHGGEVGKMSLELVGKQRERSGWMELSQKPHYFEPGHNYSAVVTGADVGIPKRVQVSWEYIANPGHSRKNWQVTKTPRIYVAYIVVQTMEHRSLQKFCPSNQEPVQATNKDFERNPVNEFREEYCQ